jgi:hypothetical protein
MSSWARSNCEGRRQFIAQIVRGDVHPADLDEHLLTSTPSPARSSGSARGRSSLSIIQAEPDVKAGQNWRRAFANPLLNGWAQQCPCVEEGGEWIDYSRWLIAGWLSESNSITS